MLLQIMEVGTDVCCGVSGVDREQHRMIEIKEVLH